MKETKLSYYKGIKDTSSPSYVVSLEKCVQRIKEGSERLVTIINAIRKEKSKEKRNELKKQLYCIVPAGEFVQRSDNGLITHSGLMVMDFDNIPKKELLSFKDEVISNPYVVVAFISPSGDGIKAFIRIEPCTADIHKRTFNSFLDDFKLPYTDKVNCNVSRVCFESFDPSIYVNYEAEIYKPSIPTDSYTYIERVPTLPVDDDMEKIERIMRFDWKTGYNEGERNHFIFSIAGMMCEYGVSKDATEGYILNNVVIGDFTEREALTAIRSAYKSRQFGIKYFENNKKIQQVRNDIALDREIVKKKHNISDDVYTAIKEEAEIGNYWRMTKVKGEVKPKIDPFNFKRFLEANGFNKHYPHGALKSNFVHIKHNKVKDASRELIKDFVLNDLLNRGEIDVWAYFATYSTVFSEEFLQMLETIELTMLKDTREKSFFAFNNGVLEVTKNSRKIVDYLDLDAYIWDSHIIKRDYQEAKDQNDFKTFIGHISGNNTLPIEVSIGYMIHTFKTLSNNKALIINDAVISDAPEGGTGKGMIFQAISQMRRVAILDGKHHDDDKTFAYQTVPLDVQVLVFDDVKKGFDFEKHFSVITEGITLERKNKDAIKLSVSDSPKIGITTNYAIKGRGEAHDRRRHEIELQAYYNSQKTPLDVFGRHLFIEWTKDDYTAFDNYMIGCLQKYLNHGLIKQESDSVDLRKFIAQTNSDFYEFVSENNNVPLNVRHNKREKFSQFIAEYPDYKFYKQKTFTIWCELYSRYINANYTSGSSNGNHWFCIETDPDKVEVDEFDTATTKDVF